MQTDYRIAVTSPHDRVGGYMGGVHANTPILTFGGTDRYDAPVLVTVNPRLLTPAEQVAWLRNLAAEVTALAEQVEQRAAVTA